VSAGLHWLHKRKLPAGLTAGHLIDAALAIGRHPRKRARALADVS
jgi:hypothetical protein